MRTASTTTTAMVALLFALCASPARADAPTTAPSPARTDAAAIAPSPSLAITVRAHGFRDATGQALVALYRSSDTWLKIDRAFRRTSVPIHGDTVEVRFDALPPGEYAVAVVHDHNGNGKLDMRWFPWPKPREGAGVSNGATGGPPKWRDAKLWLSATTAVDVTLIY